MPPGMVPTLIGELFFGVVALAAMSIVYNQDGTVAATIQERPRDLFNRVFGVIEGAGIPVMLENSDCGGVYSTQ